MNLWMLTPPPEPRFGCYDCQPCHGSPCDCDCHDLGEDPVERSDRLSRRFERDRYRRLNRKEAAIALETVYGAAERRRIMKGGKP